MAAFHLCCSILIIPAHWAREQSSILLIHSHWLSVVIEQFSGKVLVKELLKQSFLIPHELN